MAQVRLTSGKVALVDDADYEAVSQFKWNAHFERGRWYACRSTFKGGKRGVVRMHRQILGAGPKDIVDHKNHDGLDNRRENIRICTKQQNQQNMKGHGLWSKGVTFSKVNKRNPWVARIHVSGKTICLGYYKTEGEAASAYREAAHKYHGEFAYTGTS